MSTEEKKEDIASPYVEKIDFNYDKLRDETTLPALKEIAKIIADNVDKCFFPTGVSKEEQENGFGEVSKLVMKSIVDNKVIDADMQYLIAQVQFVMYSLVNLVVDYKNELETELIGRTLESKDPGTGEIVRNFGTLSDLFVAVEKKRKEQGVN